MISFPLFTSGALGCSFLSIYLITYQKKKSGSLNQGFLCEQDGGSGGAEEDIKGYQILGTKILSERKKNGKTFCHSCGSNQCAGSLIGCFSGVF